MAPDSPRFLTLPDVAETLNVTTRQVYALVRTGDLRGVQIGGRGQWRVEVSELEDYIARLYVRADEALMVGEPENQVETSKTMHDPGAG